MARFPGDVRGAVLLMVAAFAALGTGCAHNRPLMHHGQAPLVSVPPAGTVPVELAKQMLPEYVMEPPDVLRIEAMIRVPDEKNPKKPSDQIKSLPLQPVWGEYQIRPDGTVYLGIYGSVPVAGYTLTQAAAAVRAHLAKKVFAEADGVNPDFLLVVLDVTQYNSKRYYVISDGGGAGEQVQSFPISGSETVLDALSNVGGLSPVSSKRNIWVARRCPTPGLPEQILPVDWIGMTQHGVTATNYQIMPGDRIYVKAQRIVTVDTTLARILSPLERLLGITLLGGGTVNTLTGRGIGGNGGGF